MVSPKQALVLVALAASAWLLWRKQHAAALLAAGVAAYLLIEGGGWWGLGLGGAGDGDALAAPERSTTGALPPPTDNQTLKVVVADRVAYVFGSNVAMTPDAAAGAIIAGAGSRPVELDITDGIVNAIQPIKDRLYAADIPFATRTGAFGVMFVQPDGTTLWRGGRRALAQAVADAIAARVRWVVVQSPFKVARPMEVQATQSLRAAGVSATLALGDAVEI